MRGLCNEDLYRAEGCPATTHFRSDAKESKQRKATRCRGNTGILECDGLCEKELFEKDVCEKRKVVTRVRVEIGNKKAKPKPRAPAKAGA
jgi:hypothetical protein